MASLQDLNTVARRLTLELREGLERLERMEGSGGAPPALARELTHKSSELQSIAAQMERAHRQLVLHESGGAKRDLWRRKVETVLEEAAALSAALERCGAASDRRAAEERSRSELFHRSASNGPGSDVARSLAADYDAEAGAYASATRANRALEDMLEGGGRILIAMGAQRERLKSVQRKALDVLHAAGLSDVLLRTAERRQRGDAALVYGGMVVTLLCFGALMYFVRK